MHAALRPAGPSWWGIVAAIALIGYVVLPLVGETRGTVLCSGAPTPCDVIVTSQLLWPEWVSLAGSQDAAGALITTGTQVVWPGQTTTLPLYDPAGQPALGGTFHVTVSTIGTMYPPIHWTWQF